MNRSASSRLHSPYPGLRPFEAHESELFFGRGEQIADMLTRLESRRFLAVVGPSGCGKSSLVRAGLVPALHDGYLATSCDAWQIVLMRPGEDPLANLARQIVATGVGSSDLNADHRAARVALTLAMLRGGPAGLVQALRDNVRIEDRNVLVLVDQFEELFRFRPTATTSADALPSPVAHRQASETLVSLLLSTAAQQDVPIYVVITMRSDFLGNCDRFAGLPEALNDGQYLTPRMSRAQWKQAIERPAMCFGGRIEPALVNEILNDIGSDPDQLPLMQHALARCWKSAEKANAGASGGVLVGLEQYRSMGGLATALSDHADQAFHELDAGQQRVAEVLFRCVSERRPKVGDTRRPATVATIAAVAGVGPEQVIPVADAFRRIDRSFLAPPGATPLEPASLLDVSHESLIRQWRRMQDWVEAEAESAATYRRLLETARLWAAGKAGLWDTPDLENAIAWRTSQAPNEAWAARYGGDFRLANRFLDASLEAQQRRAGERRRWQRILLGVLLSVLLVVSTAAVIAFRQRQLAREARDRAETAWSTTAEMIRRFGETIDATSNPDASPSEIRETLQQSADELATLVHQRGNSPRLRAILAQTYFFQGQIAAERLSSTDALTYFERAADLQAELLGTSRDDLADAADAVDAAVMADDASVLSDLGYTLMAIGNVHQREARVLAERASKASASDTKDGLLQGRDDLLRRALDAFSLATRIRQRLFESGAAQDADQNAVASAWMNLGVTQHDLDQFDAAEQSLRNASGMLAQHSADESARTLTQRRDFSYNLARSLMLQARSVEARGRPASEVDSTPQLLTRARRLVETALESDDRLPDVVRSLAVNRHKQILAMQLLGDVLGLEALLIESSEARLEDAVAQYERALSAARQLVDDEPENVQFAETRQAIIQGMAAYEQLIQKRDQKPAEATGKSTSIQRDATPPAVWY